MAPICCVFLSLVVFFSFYYLFFFFRDVTRHLQMLLRREGHYFKTSAEFEVVRAIKEV